MNKDELCVMGADRQSMIGDLAFTGERFVPSISGHIALEHWHRYLFALEFAKNKVVLDIACGEGYGSAAMAQVATKVYGVDISVDAVNHANAAYQRANLIFKCGSCESIPLPDACVDLIVSFETIEHHDKHEEMMAEIRRVLKPSGLLLISSPDKYEYSDVPKTQNEFHVKELYFNEFRDLLLRSFKNQVFLGQRVLFGSGILVTQTHSKLNMFNLDSQGMVSGPEFGMPRTLYWLALVSNGSLPEVASSFLEHPLLNSDVGVEYRRLLQIENELRARANYLESALQRVLTSWSWKITEPLRILLGWLKLGKNLLRRQRDENAK